MAKVIGLVLAILLSVSNGFVIESKVIPTANGRIFGGQNAEEGQFPYQVSIRRTSNLNHNCGGSIINSKWILTAAHCVINSSPSDWFIFAGSVSLSDADGISRDVVRIIYHENYDDVNIKNDVAVLELGQELEFSNRIQSIELETENIGEVDSVVSGWGLTPNGIIPDHLQYINVRTISLQDCQAAWGSFSILASEICTVVPSGMGVCTGDSGGPLVANGRQIGIVSWGSFCGSGRPEGFARVSSFIEWIEEATRS